MNKKILFILDRAHGEDVNGKSSPDKSFKEWEFSQKTIDTLIVEMDKLKIPYVLTVKEKNEVGLLERVKRGNNLSKGVELPIFISLHNNGGGGTGNEIFVKTNPNKDEITIANIIANRFKRDFPNLRWRQHTIDKLYKEANYVVLIGNKAIKPVYNGILLEFLFMDNNKDLEMLKDEKIFKKYIDTLLKSFVEICNHYKYGDFLIL